jgi:3-oxoacyl-[acyl-carrier protein] reductase
MRYLSTAWIIGRAGYRALIGRSSTWLAKLRAMIDLSGKAAVVTGGSRGIGRAIVLQLAEQGADVAFSFRGNADAAAEVVELVKQKGRKALSVQGDARDPASAEALVKAALDEFGKVDILVNNAGITRDNLLFKMTEPDWDAVIGVHLRGSFLMTRAVQGHMTQEGFGRIVNLSSTSALGNRGQANYSAAKAGLQGFTKTLALELGKFGVTANAVAPGFIVTEMTRNTAERLGVPFDDFVAYNAKEIPVQRVGQPEDIAATISFLTSDEAGFVNGQVIYVAGGPRD